MKKGLIFAATLAMTLGVGAAVGAHQQKAARAEAYTDRTVYCAIDPTTLSTYTLKLNVNVGDGNTWLQSDMVEVDDTTSYPGKKIYKGTFAERYNGVDAMQFQLYDGGEWKAQDQVISGYKTYDNYSGKLHVYGGAANSWAAYTEPSVVVHTVAVYVDGVKRGDEPIEDGHLPDEPALVNYGDGFTGWFDDAACTAGHEVEEITSNTTVYGKIIELPKITYTIDDSRVQYSTLKLYAYEDTRKNAAWPGEAIVNKTIEVPNDATIIINDGTKQTVNVTQSGVANDTLRILLAEDAFGHNEVQWLSDADEPDSAGYYLVGSKTNFKFKNSTKMTEVNPSLSSGNVAILDGYQATAGEKIKVRTFGVQDKPEWSFNVDGTKAYGEQDEEGNFVFANDLSSYENGFDVYAFMENSELKFSVAPAAEKVLVTLAAKMYDGSHSQGEVTIGQFEVVKGQPYSVPTLARDGYVQLKAYNDFNCTDEYENGTILESNKLIHIKYMEVGFYTLYGSSNYEIEGATKMLTQNIGENNKAEATITAAVNDTFSFVYYDENGVKHGHAGLGDSYSFVADEDTHIKFSKAGTYTIYWQKDALGNKLYVNAGLTAFYTYFITEVGGTCNSQGGTDLESLSTVWAHQKAAYLALSDEDKAAVEAITYDGGDEKGTLGQQVIAKYHYIIEKYGTAQFEDFIWGRVDIKGTNNPTIINFNFTSENNTVLFVTIGVTVAAIAALAFFVIRYKKKED